VSTILLTVYIVGFFVQWPLIARHLDSDGAAFDRVGAVVLACCMSLAWPTLIVGAIIYKIAFPTDKEDTA
jgi:hypothetical protein